MADLDQATWVGFVPHFARFRDVHGESLEVVGFMYTTRPRTAELEDERAKAMFTLLDPLSD